MDKKLKKACCGKNKSQGGLNLPEFREHAKRNGILNADRLSRTQLQELCNVDCGKEYSSENVRTRELIEKTIKNNPKYRDMVPDAAVIAFQFVNQDNCELCGAMFDIENSFGERQDIKDAIDHDHCLEKSGMNSYRGRLCQRCNTSEGISKKKSEPDVCCSPEIVGVISRVQLFPPSVEIST